MSFGTNYHYQKQPKILADGDYEIKIGKPFETQVSGFSVLRFPFTVDGETGPVVPNYFDLFDCSDATDEKQLEYFNKTASKIKACFNLAGQFDESNYIKWNGKKGKVRIEKSKAGFVNVVQFYKAELTPEEEANL